MVETGEGEGLPRATFNYHLFCRNVGRKVAVSSHLCYHKIKISAHHRGRVRVELRSRSHTDGSGVARSRDLIGNSVATARRPIELRIKHLTKPRKASASNIIPGGRVGGRSS